MENEERIRKGKKPLTRRREELEKPTQLMQQRKFDLHLDRNLGKTMMVDNASSGRGPGFYCELCSRTCKDSAGYLDHINGRTHLRRLGQTTQVARSTLDQVRAKIASLRERSAQAVSARTYDFESRIREIAEKEEKEKEERRNKRRDKRRRVTEKEGVDSIPTETDQEAMLAMGFGSFASTKKR
ncbi:hypothetical protein IE53DRAFT_315543 [Violaceomyces palustris]|uniref:Uncharacterized protein n=1 Tax=Violaceomyces palustris TaxID=1673888 RepID=A0ACD0NXT7_9BASI|nr:hypothetical protein IE53DRAFT_315543 [Violaceomyces palustris]